MRQNFLTRQADLLPVELLGEKITVIGAGAIGSFTVLQLAKLGFEEIKVFDDDTVSEENMNSQFYRVRDIGRPKVEALQEIVQDFTEVEIEIVKGRYEAGTFPGLVIVAVDNMATRQLVFDNHQLKAPNTKFIIDPRMGAETAMLYVVNPLSEADGQTYRKTLYADHDAVQEPCTAKATMYTVNLLSGLVAKTVKDIVTKATHLSNVSWDVKTFSLQAWNSKKENPNLCQVPMTIDEVMDFLASRPMLRISREQYVQLEGTLRAAEIDEPWTYSVSTANTPWLSDAAARSMASTTPPLDGLRHAQEINNMRALEREVRERTQSQRERAPNLEALQNVFRQFDAAQNSDPEF
jgi:molybdopterin/thiamine biosynthesis adenylyltransferase